MKLFRRRRKNLLFAPEAAAAVATAQMTPHLLEHAIAEFNRVYGHGAAQPETIHVPSERADLQQLESPHPDPPPTQDLP